MSRMGEAWHSIRPAFRVVLYLLATLNLALCAEGSVERISAGLFGQPSVPSIANNSANASLGLAYSDDSPRITGWVDVTAVEPGGAADKAGIAPGDRLRFPQLFGGQLAYGPGQSVMVQRDRNGDLGSVRLTARSYDPPEAMRQALVMLGVAMLIMVALAALLLTRGKHSRAARMLALFFAAFALASPLGWFPLWVTPVVRMFVEWPLRLATVYFLLAFALELSGGKESRRQVWLANTVGALFALANLVVWIGDATGRPMSSEARFVPLVILGVMVALAIIAWNYRGTDAAGRNRIKIVVAALASFAISFVLARIAQLLGFGLTLILPAGFVTMLVLLAYGAIAQRLFDFSFAVNRTLVYGAAAFTLLVTFGLVEYIAKSMIPVAWPTAGPFISAGIAVLLFLMFHRLHHWFEHHIERLFFREWQQAEAALRRFVESAGHYERESALCADAASELTRFAAEAHAALYRRTSEGTYTLCAGKLPGAKACYDNDGRGFALMRTERCAIDLPAANQPLPGALALPMLDQGSLFGFVLLAAKPDDLRYRPDEVENLAWAVQQVGLDLQALEARALRTQVEALAADRAQLATDRDRLAGLLERFAPANLKT